MKARYIGNPNLTVGKVYEVNVDPDNKYLYDLLPDGEGNCLTCVSMDHFEIIPEEPEYHWCVCVSDVIILPQNYKYKKGDVLEIKYPTSGFPYIYDEKANSKYGNGSGVVCFINSEICRNRFRLLTDAEYAELAAQPDEWMV